MKILLDESTPQKLRFLIDIRHAVATTSFAGWSGLQNGELHMRAEDAGFEIFITADQELRYQQNMTGRNIAIVILSTNNWSVIKDHVGEITAAINAAIPGEFSFVDIGHGWG